MKKILLIVLLMLGVVFSGCAGKHEDGLNESTSGSFAGNLITSGNPVLMGIGAVVGVATMHGIEETEMREQYNALTDEQKQQYLDFMRPCMLDLNKIAMDKLYEGVELSESKRKFAYDKTLMHLMDLDRLSKPGIWRKGIKHFSVYRNQCHPQALKEILGTEQVATAPVSEEKEITENQTTQNQTPTLNNTEKVEENKK